MLKNKDTFEKWGWVKFHPYIDLIWKDKPLQSLLQTVYRMHPLCSTDFPKLRWE